MESTLKHLTKHVECSICMNAFTEPKTIACLHTFCCECLKKHALVNQREGMFRCPECQAQVRVPEGNGFEQLPTSLYHSNLLRLLAVRQSSGGREISCDLCKKKSTEISYCFECENLMCSVCTNAHELFRCVAFDGHKVTPAKEFQPEDYEAMLKRKAFCAEQYHERELAKFYCHDCQSCICHMCILLDHKDHKIEPLEKAADAERAKILAEVEQMKRKNEACNDVIRQFEAAAANMQSNFATAQCEVSQSAAEMVAAVRQREREAIAALENIRVSQNTELDAAKRKTELLTKQLNQAAEFVSDLSQRSSSADMHEQTKKNLLELGKTDIPTVPVSSYLKFAPACTSDNLSLGYIRTSGVEGLNQNFQVGIQAEISICLKTQGRQFSNNQHEDQVEVLVEPADQLTSFMINEESRGNFQVKFVPKRPGVYKIFVKINGEDLDQSPFNIEVKPERWLELLD